MTQLVSKPDHRTPIGELDGKPIFLSDLFQNFFDDLEEKLNTNLLGDSVKFPEYAVADLPDATENTGGHVNVTDETGGYTGAFSDGTSWRRYQDRNIVS